MKYLTVLAGIALCFASCATDKSNKAAEAEAECECDAKCATEVSVDGQWKLTQYNIDDNDVLVAEDAEYVLNFMPADSTFNMTTDCNSIGGKYVIDGDKVKFDNLFMTRMACPDPKVEEAMNKVFATANGIAVDNDAVLQLKNDDKVLAQFTKMAATEEPAADAE